MMMLAADTPPIADYADARAAAAEAYARLLPPAYFADAMLATPYATPLLMPYFADDY